MAGNSSRKLNSKIPKSQKSFNFPQQTIINLRKRYNETSSPLGHNKTSTQNLPKPQQKLYTVSQNRIIITHSPKH